jgi:hypothetical protein
MTKEELNIGDVVVVKASGEIVSVAEFGDGEEIFIRQPRLTENGIQYFLLTFYSDELESVQDHANREMTHQLAKLEAQRNILAPAIRKYEKEDAEAQSNEFNKLLVN